MLPGPTVSPYAELAHKWRMLALRRRAYFIELYQTGRWKHYYKQADFMVRLREVIDNADEWERLAAKPPDAGEPPPAAESN